MNGFRPEMRRFVRNTAGTIGWGRVAQVPQLKLSTRMGAPGPDSRTWDSENLSMQAPHKHSQLAHHPQCTRKEPLKERAQFSSSAQLTAYTDMTRLCKQGKFPKSGLPKPDSGTSPGSRFKPVAESRPAIWKTSGPQEVFLPHIAEDNRPPAHNDIGER
jgi:hypothetical protein